MARARSLYFGVGMLILTGAALAIGFVLFLTSGRLGRDAAIYETYLRESVTGLDIGASVRYRGVAIGRVTEINLVSAVYPMQGVQPNEPSYQLVLVRFAVDQVRLGSVPGLVDAVAHGLRIRLASQGITGVTYLELDITDPARAPPQVFPWLSAYPVIPSVPSTVAQVTSVAERLAQRLEGVDIEGLLSGINGLLGDLRAIAQSDDVRRTLREAAESMTAIHAAVADADLPGAVSAFRTALRSVEEAAQALRDLAASPDIASTLTSASQAAADLRTAIARLPAAIQSLDSTIRAARTVTTDTQADLVPLLRDLRATAANLRDVTEALRRSPSQAIFGAPPPQDRR